MLQVGGCKTRSRTSPTPSPKSDTEVRPRPGRRWSENRTIVRNFDQDAAVTAESLRCTGNLPGRTGPNTEQLFGFLTREAR